MSKTVHSLLGFDFSAGADPEVYPIAYRHALDDAFETRLSIAEEALLNENTPPDYTLEIEAVTDWDHAQAAAHWQEWLVEAEAEISGRAKLAQMDAAWWDEWFAVAEARAQEGRRGAVLSEIGMAAAMPDRGPKHEANALGLAHEAATTRGAVVGGGEIAACERR